MTICLSLFLSLAQAEVATELIDDYTKMEIEGWTVQVHKDLLEEDNETGKKAAERRYYDWSAGQKRSDSCASLSVCFSSFGMNAFHSAVWLAVARS